MIRARHGYTLLSSEQSEPSGSTTPTSPSFFDDDDDEEEKLTRPPPIVYPQDPRFDQPTPPAWQRAGLILFILTCLFLAVWLQNGFWIGAIV
ncbi:hypothetical protein R3P38DRAFT_1344877 [Favolaschia claudopus]|uniref:Uncharacterized protein n=1 Tax=Favolaschia claudopus TaxID=2862362 RepID=A0AAW0DVZ4_9AGAR